MISASAIFHEIHPSVLGLNNAPASFASAWPIPNRSRSANSLSVIGVREFVLHITRPSVPQHVTEARLYTSALRRGMTEPVPREEPALRSRAEREEPRPDPLAPARGILLAVGLGAALWLALVLFLTF